MPTKKSAPESASKVRALEKDKTAPSGWVMSGAGPGDYQVHLDQSETHVGRRSARMSNKSSNPQQFGTMMQQFKPDSYLGKRLKFSLWLKTNLTSGWSQPWLRVDGKGSRPSTLRFDNCCDRSLTGNHDWTKYDLVLEVPDESVNIAFGIMMCGRGKVWIDGITIGEALKDDENTDCPCFKAKREGPQNLDFEED